MSVAARKRLVPASHLPASPSEPSRRRLGAGVKWEPKSAPPRLPIPSCRRCRPAEPIREAGFPWDSRGIPVGFPWDSRGTRRDGAGHVPGMGGVVGGMKRDEAGRRGTAAENRSKAGFAGTKRDAAAHSATVPTTASTMTCRGERWGGRHRLILPPPAATRSFSRSMAQPWPGRCGLCTAPWCGVSGGEGRIGSRLTIGMAGACA